jgi:putative Ca2+/H+ antiporter (TMEM165/GDT1 family)
MRIDWQVLVSAFTMIFLAELGDKTQISALAFASRTASPLSVFLGTASALVLTSLIAVALGDVVGRVLPEKVLRLLAGLVFIGFGVFSIVGTFRR